MADIRAAFGTSHAFALLPPAAWDGFRTQNQAVYEGRFGHIPPDRPQLLEKHDPALWLSAMKSITSERTSQ